eukprot:SAG31_NODE_25154_length_467_cov_0.671196_1_plen_88_part_10
MPRSTTGAALTVNRPSRSVLTRLHASVLQAGKEQLSTPDALLRYSSAADRSRGLYGLLQPNWQKALERWVAPLRPLFANGTASGVFVG